MKKIVDSFSWVFLTLFTLPTVLIIASWNSLPGDLLHGLKLALEDTVITVAPTYSAKNRLYVKYTQRRFNEANKLLNEKESTQGLPYFTAQMQETKESIINAPDDRTRRELAYNYIDTLSQFQAELESQRLAYGRIRNSRTQPAVNPTLSTTTSTQSYNPAPQQPTQPPDQQPTQPPDQQQSSSVEEEISNTEDDVEEVIDDLVDIVNRPPNQLLDEPEPSPTKKGKKIKLQDKNNDDNDDDSDNDQGQGSNNGYVQQNQNNNLPPTVSEQNDPAG